MADKSKIEWTDATWSPIVGCSKVSEGCLNCYAEKMASRLAAMGHTQYRDVLIYSNNRSFGWNGKTAFVESALEKPLHWRKPRMIFVCSMSDLFHESVPFEWVSRVFSKIIFTDDIHTYQILTKRPERALEYFTDLLYWSGVKRIPAIWLGVTCENQKTADERIPILLQIPAAVRFLSLEPLLEDIDLTDIHPHIGLSQDVITDQTKDAKHFNEVYKKHLKEPYVPDPVVDQVIIGCESLGAKAGRFQDGFWNAAQNIITQCKSANVPVFVKQGPIKGRVEHDINKFPEFARLRQYPK